VLPPPPPPPQLDANTTAIARKVTRKTRMLMSQTLDRSGAADGLGLGLGMVCYKLCF
jgi:glycerate kinase